MMNFLIGSFDDLNNAASEILKHSKFNIFTLSGNLGAGKTTFVKEIVKLLGSEDRVVSPTFSLINEYLYPSGSIYHFDLYRIKCKEELINIGFYEYIDSGNYCFIEWPKLTFNELDGYHKITIELKENYRHLTFF